jgi:hypothetical protein
MIFREYAINRMFRDGKFDECIKRAKDLKEVYFKRGQKDKGYLICILIAKSYLKLKEYDMAEKYIALYEKCSYLKGDLKKISGRDVPLYILKGKLYLMKGLLDSAEFYLKKTYPNYLSHKNELAAYSALCNLYERNNQRDSLYKYSILYTQAKEKSFNESNTQNIILAQSLYDYSVEQREAKEAPLSRRNWIIGALSATFLLTLLALWLRRQVKQKQLKLQEANKEKERLRTEMEEKEQTIKWLKEQVEEKKIIINSLNETINQNAVDQQLNNQMQQTIGLLQKQVEEYERKINLHLMARKLNELLQNENIARVIKRGEERIGRPAAEEWKTIYALVEEFCPKFTEFKNNISITEYQICVLLKLGCKLSDIGYLTGLDSNNLSVMRLRLLNKIFNTKEGGATMFDKRIREL